MQTLSPINLSDKTSIEGKLHHFYGLSCEYSFQNLFNWREIYDIKWTELNGAIYLYYGLENSLLMPVPNPRPSELVRFPCIFNLPKENFSICHVTKQYISSNADIDQYFILEDDNLFFDYVHIIDKLVDLKGSKLAKKKNLISQFIRNNPSYECKFITPELFQDCLLFAEKCYLVKTCEHVGITHEKSAIKKAFEHFNEIDLEGLAIFANNKICAFSIFSRQNKETFIEHFEKADSTIKGAAQIINWETAKYLQGKAKFLNREQDLGIAGLRKSKNSYAPDLLIGGKILKIKSHYHPY